MRMFFLFGALLLTSHAAAYIDPGTAGIVVGSIWGVICALVGLVGGFFGGLWALAKTKLWPQKKHSQGLLILALLGVMIAGIVVFLGAR